VERRWDFLAGLWGLLSGGGVESGDPSSTPSPISAGCLSDSANALRAECRLNDSEGESTPELEVGPRGWGLSEPPEWMPNASKPPEVVREWGERTRLLENLHRSLSLATKDHILSSLPRFHWQ